MATVLVHHEVADYDQWKKHFDAGAEKRTAKGISHMHMGRHNDNPNHVYLVFEVADASHLLDHLEHGNTKELQGAGGVVGENHVVILN